jgi:hypothetical protein
MGKFSRHMDELGERIKGDGAPRRGDVADFMISSAERDSVPWKESDRIATLLQLALKPGMRAIQEFQCRGAGYAVRYGYNDSCALRIKPKDQPLGVSVVAKVDPKVPITDGKL